MSINASRPSVGTAATKIAENTAGSGTPDSSIKSFVAKNRTGTASVFLGSNTVTTVTGFEWEVLDGPFPFDLEPGESMWGIVAATAQTLHVMSGGR